jgi:hypothetical protein
LRFTDSVFEPPWKVGVAPSTEPDEDATVTLCASGAALVKLIVTAPAFAVSVLVLNESWPSGLAARLSVLAALVPPVVAAGVEVVAGVVLAGVLAEELVLLEELPHPARTGMTSASKGSEHLRRRRDFAWTAAVNVTV